MKDELEGCSWQREQRMPRSEKRGGSFKGRKAGQCGWDKEGWGRSLVLSTILRVYVVT